LKCGKPQRGSGQKHCLFIKKQQEALDSQVKTLTKEKKKENVLTYLELINLKMYLYFNMRSLEKK
jgi:hypothetical protein